MSIFKDRFPFVKARTSSQPFARSEAPYPRAKRIPSITQTLVRVVRLTGIIILLGFLHVSAGINAQERISINMKSARLEKVFAEIEQRSGYTVFYNTEVLKYSGPITVEMKDATIADVMRQVLKGLPLEFNIQDKTIFVKHVKPSAASSDSEGPGKNGTTPSTVSGVVQTETGQPLVGATVYIRKLKKTGVTDGKGEVALKDVPDGEYEVEISYVGFERFTAKITVVNHEAVFSAALKQMMSKLDETVVKAYYTTTNRLNTGDVTTVKGEDIQKQPVSDPILALEGRVPGMYIQQASGVPGAYGTITIRGQNSIANGNDPLYIVDGVPFSSISLTSPNIRGGAAGAPNGNGISNVQGNLPSGGGLSPFNSLNPADIESVEVLKDADATAIYGSRGANGVVLITTKRGKPGKTRFNLNIYTGGGQVARDLNLMNTTQYLAMRKEAFANDGLAVPSILTNPKDNNYDINGVWDTTRYTNWQKVLIDNVATFTNAQGEISGGSANTQFNLGGGYSNQGTVYPGNYSDRKASVHINLTNASDDQRFHLQFIASYLNDNSNLASADFTSLVTLAPDAPILYTSTGALNWQTRNGTATFQNPLVATAKHDNSVTDNLMANMKLGYEILPGLQIKSAFGFSHMQMNQSNLTPSTSIAPPNNANPAYRENDIATADAKTWIIEPQLDFRKKIAKGQLEALAGSTFQQKSSTSMFEQAAGFASDALVTDFFAGTIIVPGSNTNVLYHYDAIYGRVSFDWDEKYLINMTGRRDGSSRFGPGKQFGDFGAIGVGWIFSNENFFQQAMPLLSFGKLRASYGTTGNDQIMDYQYLSTYSPSGSSYENVSSLQPTRMPNPYFAWEVVKKLEGGIELGFLKDRILLTASYFRNRTGNQLVGYSLPILTGFSTVQFNLPAVVQNTGLELVLNSTIVKTKDFTWTSAINYTLPNNKLVSFPNLANYPSYKTQYEVGKSLFIKWRYHSTGVNPQTGLYSFSTKNASGLPSSQDESFTKPITQKFYGGFENSFAYKRFRLDVFLQYVSQLGTGFQNFIATPGFSNVNQPIAVLSRWQSTGNLTNIQRFGTNSTTSTRLIYFKSSDGIYTDASFLRFKNIVVSYEIPTESRTKLHIQNLRVYIQCQNLLTISHYQGLDPETGGGGLPPLRMITGGIHIGL